MSARTPGEQVATDRLAPDSPAEVFSLSPDDAAPPSLDARGHHVPLASRLMDETSLESAASTLRSLIEEAVEASAGLQERLRLSARMLKATQTMAERAEKALDRLAKRERALADLERWEEGAQDRGEAIARLVESAEVNVAVLSHKSARAAAEAHEKAARARDLILRCEQALARLSERLNEAAKPASGARPKD